MGEESLKLNARKEIDRMEKVFSSVKIKDHKELFDFARDYFDDSKHFYDKKKYLEAFEAAIIAWAYIDVCLKLGFCEVPASLKKTFTV